MKKHKRMYMVISLLLAAAICAAGCSKKAGETVDKLTAALLAAKTVSHLQKENSADLDAEIDFGVEGDFGGLLQNFGFSAEDASLSAETKTTLSVQAARDPAAVHYTGSTAIGPPSGHSMDIPQEGYVVLEEETPVSYQKLGPIWYRQILETEDTASGKEASADTDTVKAGSETGISGLDVFVRVLQAISDDSLKAELRDGKETVNEQESYVMNVSLTGDLLKEAVTAAMQGLSSGRGSGMVDLEETDWDNITADARFYIAADGYLPVRAEIDVHELMNAALNSALSDSDIMKLLDGVEVSVTDMEIDVDFNEFGTAEDITVPQDVRKSAVRTQ